MARVDQTQIEIVCTADVIDQRDMTGSGGHREKRWVIQTQIVIGHLCARYKTRYQCLGGFSSSMRTYYFKIQENSL